MRREYLANCLSRLPDEQRELIRGYYFDEETTESDNHEVSEGNRGEESGRNLEQLDKVRGTP